MSFIVSRKITGLPCGQVVGDEVSRSRSISHCIFSGVSFILILTAALHANEAAMSSRKVDFALSRLSSPRPIKYLRQKDFSASTGGRSVGIDLIATVRPDSPHYFETEGLKFIFCQLKCFRLGRCKIKRFGKQKVLRLDHTPSFPRSVLIEENALMRDMLVYEQ
jgi:hypothetical protein